MKYIYIIASLLAVSCNYKSESEKKLEESILFADCTAINSDKTLIHLKEIQLDAINRIIRATGKATPEQKKEIESIPQEIDSLKTDIDRLKTKIYYQIKQQ